MFLEDEEEYVLLNGELHPRGKRVKLDLCNTSCFGAHSLSRDKKWSSWGLYWVPEWVDWDIDPANRNQVTRTFWKLLIRVMGMSVQRYEMIRRMTYILWPREMAEDLIPAYEDLPESEEEKYALMERIGRSFGITNVDSYNVLTCGQCSLVCAANIRETAERCRALWESGIVVPGPDGREMVRVDTFEEALQLRKSKLPKLDPGESLRDLSILTSQFLQYFGIEPRSFLKGRMYDRELRRAVREMPASGSVARSEKQGTERKRDERQEFAV